MRLVRHSPAAPPIASPSFNSIIVRLVPRKVTRKKDENTRALKEKSVVSLSEKSSISNSMKMLEIRQL